MFPSARLRALVLPVCALLTLLAAPAPAEDCDCPDSFEDVIASPRRLMDRATAAVQASDLERSFLYLSLIRRLHPDSEQADDAFVLATKIFRPLWRYQRSA